MEEQRCKLRETEKERTLIDFGVTDSRGRKIGASIERYIVIKEPLSETEIGQGFLGVKAVPGNYFAFRPHATRDGKLYGASQYGRHFEGDVSREVAIQKYLKDAKKRAGA